MNNHDLDRLLRSARVPERDANYWADFPTQVVAALGRARAASSPAPHTRRVRLAWSVGLAFACALVAAVLVWRPAVRNASPVAWLKDQRALREVLTMFPHQVRAIVRDARGIRLVLSDHPDVPTSPPLWIEFEQAGRRTAAITFSGQQIEIAGERVEVLANPQGQITLVGERLFWSSAAPELNAGGVRLRAQELPTVL
jgi:hypothetical protein